MSSDGSDLRCGELETSSIGIGSDSVVGGGGRGRRPNRAGRVGGWVGGWVGGETMITSIAYVSTKRACSVADSTGSGAAKSVVMVPSLSVWGAALDGRPPESVSPSEGVPEVVEIHEAFRARTCATLRHLLRRSGQNWPTPVPLLRSHRRRQQRRAMNAFRRVVAHVPRLGTCCPNRAKLANTGQHAAELRPEASVAGA